MHDVTRAGLLGALLEISMLYQVGIEVQIDRIPLHPEVVCFAQAFNFNPLRMISSSTLVATVPPEHVGAAMHTVEGENVRIHDVGRVTKGGGVRLRHGEQVREFLEPATEEDELARMWRIYPREG